MLIWESTSTYENLNTMEWKTQYGISFSQVLKMKIQKWTFLDESNQDATEPTKGGSEQEPAIEQY